MTAIIWYFYAEHHRQERELMKKKLDAERERQALVRSLRKGTEERNDDGKE